jgi:hypothetical protein
MLSALRRIVTWRYRARPCLSKPYITAAVWSRTQVLIQIHSIEQMEEAKNE